MSDAPTIPGVPTEPDLAAKRARGTLRALALHPPGGDRLALVALLVIHALLG
jgi:hypothetical protein